MRVNSKTQFSLYSGLTIDYDSDSEKGKSKSKEIYPEYSRAYSGRGRIMNKTKKINNKIYKIKELYDDFFFQSDLSSGFTVMSLCEST